MQQTSLEAYAAIADHLGPRQAEVFEIIRQYGPMNNTQIAAQLNWPINCVTGRVLELRRKGKVDSHHVSKDIQGHHRQARQLLASRLAPLKI